MRHRIPRSAIVAAVAVVALVAACLAPDPLVEWRTRVILSRLEGMQATFSDVEVRLADLSCAIRDLRLEKRTAGGAALPFFEVKRARFAASSGPTAAGSWIAPPPPPSVASSTSRGSRRRGSRIA